MSITNRIRIGYAAKQLFDDIMSAANQPGGAGIFKEKALKDTGLDYVAFDCANGCCWVNSFATIQGALNWIKNGTEGVEQS